MKDIVLVVLSSLSISLLVALLITFKKLNNITIAFTKSILINDASKPGLDLADMQNDVHKENFIKFLSESRDWAFSYIEEVQDGLGTFINAVEPDIRHFEEFGDVLSTSRPEYASMKRISAAYRELIKLMPKEENQ